MHTPTEYRTTWSKQPPPYGAFDDYVIFESLKNHHTFRLRPEEFNWLMEQMYDHWIKRKSTYHQVLREWNEGTGFEDGRETPLVIEDVHTFLDALSLIEGSEEKVFGRMTREDIQLLMNFLLVYTNEGFLVRNE